MYLQINHLITVVEFAGYIRYKPVHVDKILLIPQSEISLALTNPVSIFFFDAFHVAKCWLRTGTGSS